MTAQWIEAATADKTRSGLAEGESPVANGDAPNPLYQEGYSMTDTTDQQAVTVAQEDIALAESIVAIEFDNSHAAYRDDVAATIARHRLASVSSASAEKGRVREAFSGAMRGEVVNGGAWSLHLHFGRGDGARDRMRAASSLLGSIVAASPEPVPATNQAGEVDPHRALAIKRYADPAVQRVAYLLACQLSLLGRGALTDFHEGQCAISAAEQMVFDVRSEDARAALATQPATSQEDGKSFASWSTETLAQQCRMQARDQLDPEFSSFLEEVADRIAATPTPPTLSEGLRELSERLSERAWGIQTMLQEPMWKPSRSHIEAVRNLLFEAANAFRDDAGEPPNGDEAAKAREPDTAALVVVAQRILDRGYVSSSIEEERDDHNALVAALAQVKAS